MYGKSFNSPYFQVKGINHIRLGAVRSRLTINPEQSAVPIRNGFPPSLNLIHSTPKSTPKLSSSHSSHPVTNGQVTGTAAILIK